MLSLNVSEHAMFSQTVVVLLAVIAYLMQPQQVRAKGPDRADFPFDDEVQGTAQLFQKQPVCVVVGETHGTLEIPLLVATLVRSAPSETKTVLCLEIPHTEQELLNTFLNSEGNNQAVQALLAGPHWSMRDGRAGTGHFNLLELSRRLVNEGRNLRIVAIDIDPAELPKIGSDDFRQDDVFAIARKRDKVMAENVAAVAKEHPESNLIVLVGNVHANLNAGMPWDPKYKPMGNLLRKQLTNVISLNTMSAGGEAWVSTEKGTGPTKMLGEDRGDTPFVEMFDKPTGGYSGILYVGKITAAKPARR